MRWILLIALGVYLWSRRKGQEEIQADTGIGSTTPPAEGGGPLDTTTQVEQPTASVPTYQEPIPVPTYQVPISMGILPEELPVVPADPVKATVVPELGTVMIPVSSNNSEAYYKVTPYMNEINGLAKALGVPSGVAQAIAQQRSYGMPLDSLVYAHRLNPQVTADQVRTLANLIIPV